MNYSNPTGFDVITKLRILQAYFDDLSIDTGSINIRFSWLDGGIRWAIESYLNRN